MSTIDARVPAPNTEAEQGRVPDSPPCPACGGRMWDNRTTRRNPRAPEFRCRDRSCPGRIWHYAGPDDEPPRGPKSPAPHRGGPPESIGPVVARVVASIGGAPTPSSATHDVIDRATPDRCPTQDGPPPESRHAREVRPDAPTQALYCATVGYVARRIAPLCSSLGVTISGETFAAMVATLFNALNTEHRATQFATVQRPRNMRHG